MRLPWRRRRCEDLADLELRVQRVENWFAKAAAKRKALTSSEIDELRGLPDRVGQIDRALATKLGVDVRQP